ncbi:inactive C-alpha-formylglycine-generating enzyme 2 isoform X2 [Perognathus longimembris pacificus]|uniref:inactive C-alpha-formylglycine-generating enzyme 2 isoform X2 n=1 Tax=Perognathus longimembris pacificus TaxID=214514 RepID=UPI002018880D|nr:inactive C-alpha-formylglycine-generating enzyme 2 isoform X2 [Perognathus longimembris pacificus]
MDFSSLLAVVFPLLGGRWLQLGYAQTTSMVQLPGGRFLMGTDAPDGRDGEGPAREVTVKPFAIDVFPVTNKDFREFVKEKKYRTEAEAFGWSFVFEDFVSSELRNKATQQMQSLLWWLPVEKAFWRQVRYTHGGTGSSQTAPTCGRERSPRVTRWRMASMGCLQWTRSPHRMTMGSMTSWAMYGSGPLQRTRLLARTCVSSGAHPGLTQRMALPITGPGSLPEWATLQIQPQTTLAFAVLPV